MEKQEYKFLGRCVMLVKIFVPISQATRVIKVQSFMQPII